MLICCRVGLASAALEQLHLANKVSGIQPGQVRGFRMSIAIDQVEARASLGRAPSGGHPFGHLLVFVGKPVWRIERISIDLLLGKRQSAARNALRYSVIARFWGMLRRSRKSPSKIVRGSPLPCSGSHCVNPINRKAFFMDFEHSYSCSRIEVIAVRIHESRFPEYSADKDTRQTGVAFRNPQAGKYLN